MKKYSFKKDKFCIVRKGISKEIATFMYNYLLMKEEVLHKLRESKYISPFESMHGTIGDDQVEKSGLNIYGDPANDTLLLLCQNILEKATGLQLIPTYTYSRNYIEGSELKKHKDRPSCAISATLNLGGDPWSIFIEKKEINLKPGDILVYSGCDLEHWRKPFAGEKCVQVFLHYTESKNMDLLYDTRPYLGLPPYFKK